MKILFPCNPLETNKVDEEFLDEHRAAKLKGFDCFFFDHDKFVRGNLSSNLPELSENSGLILRGWMLKVSEYEDLYNLVKDEIGYELINTPEQYKNCHYFTESYGYIKDYTAKSIIIKEWDADILNDVSEFFGDKDFIIKDFVKSEKHSDGLFKMDSGISGEELLEKVNKFIEARGSLFNEGLVFKEFVDLKKYDESVNEWRIFYKDNKMVSCSKNSNINSNEEVSTPYRFIESIVDDIAFQIDSNFFTIDVAEKSDGEWMIIETGDGQVSGLSPGQNTLEFMHAIENQKIAE